MSIGINYQEEANKQMAEETAKLMKKKVEELSDPERKIVRKKLEEERRELRDKILESKDIILLHTKGVENAMVMLKNMDDKFWQLL